MAVVNYGQQLSTARQGLRGIRKSAGKHWSGKETRNLHAYKRKISRLRPLAAPPKAVRPPPKPPVYKPPRPNPMPLDPTYMQQTAAAQRAYATTGAALQYQRGRTEQSYGFDDTTDPYNRASMLERTYKQNAMGMQNQAAARGQLYSGATTSNLDEGRYGYERNRSGLRREYDDALQGLMQRGVEAKDTYLSATGSASADRVQRALDRRAEDPGLPPPTPQQKAAAPKPKPKPKKKAPGELTQLRKTLKTLRKGGISKKETKALHRTKKRIRKVKRG